jgi:hypothetical protein
MTSLHCFQQSRNMHVSHRDRNTKRGFKELNTLGLILQTYQIEEQQKRDES